MTLDAGANTRPPIAERDAWFIRLPVAVIPNLYNFWNLNPRQLHIWYCHHAPPTYHCLPRHSFNAFSLTAGKGSPPCPMSSINDFSLSIAAGALLPP